MKGEPGESGRPGFPGQPGLKGQIGQGGLSGMPGGWPEVDLYQFCVLFSLLSHNIICICVISIKCFCCLNGVVPVAVSCILCHVSVALCSASCRVLYFMHHVSVTRCSAGSSVLYFMSCICYTV